MKRKTYSQWIASFNSNQRRMYKKISALDEAAEHLELGGWSEDQEELRQGLLVAKKLRKEAESMFNKLPNR